MTTVYLLDASVLITAHNLYYAIDAVPEYWDWLTHVGAKGLVKMPFEIFEEVNEGPDGDKDLLFAWLRQETTKSALLLPEAIHPPLVQHVISQGYAADLTDDQLEQLVRDPFLIAYALSAADRCVVTVETSEPKKQRQNRKIPDVCKTLGVACCSPFEFNRKLGFRTNWKQYI